MAFSEFRFDIGKELFAEVVDVLTNFSGHISAESSR